MGKWSIEPGTTESLRQKLMDIITSQDFRIAEIKLEREVVDIYEGPFFAESILSGAVKFKIQFFPYLTLEGGLIEKQNFTGGQG